MKDDTLQQCFRIVLNLPSDTDVSGAKYRETENWDSLAHLQIVGEIERVFDIMLETEDVVDMSSFLRAKEILGKYGISFDA